MGTHALALGRLSLGHAALGGGGLAHFILRLIIWRMIWRFVMLIWHIRVFGPGLLLLALFALVWAILRSRRWRSDTGGRPGDARDDRGSSGPDSRG